MWLVYSSVLSTTLIILLVSVIIKYLNWERLLTLGLFSPLPWDNSTFGWSCLLVYSVGLVLISFHISSKRFDSSSTSTSSSFTSRILGRNETITPQQEQQLPNSLTRLRTHLTFLPIIHFIQQQPPQGNNGSKTISVLVKDDGGRLLDSSDGISSISCNDPTSHTKDGCEKEFLFKLEFQRDALVETILQTCIHPWYERISDDKTFLLQSRKILQTFFDRLVQKFQQIDRTNLAKEVIELTHYHWKNYCEASSKVTSEDQSIGHHFKFVHDFIQVREELTRHYENLFCHLLKEFMIPDLQSTLVCQFLSGILVKGFVLYYIDLLSDPNWINTSLKKWISSGSSNLTDVNLISSVGSAGSSQESLFDFSSAAACKLMKDDSTNIHNNDSIKTNDSMDSDVYSVPLAPPPSSSSHHNPGGDSSSSSSSDSDLPQDSSTVHSTVRVNSKSTSDINDDDQGRDQTGLEKRPSLSSKRKKRTNVTTVSAALGGLLSATALPLLPGGSGYNLNWNGLDSQNFTYDPSTPSSSPNPNKTKEVNTTMEVSGAAEEDKSVMNKKEEEEEEGRIQVATVTNDKMTPTSPSSSSYRHYSLDEGPKTKTTLSSGERDTKSLDETKDNCRVSRQEEFDIHFDDNRKLQLDNPSSLNKQDISPMYDETEAEDFASTIAKLRSLLEQRESRKNLMESGSQNSEDKEVDVFKTNNTPPEEETGSTANLSSSHPQPIKNSSSADSTRPSLNSQSSQSSLGSDASNSSHCSWETQTNGLEKIVDELEETNNPVLNRFFLNVTIPKTEMCSDSNNSQFVLYCIQYEGVYIEENDDGQLEKLVLRTTTIKRRFQEFLHLQSQLEESPVWRPHVKGKARIGRSWILSENTNISQRKLILQRYLHQLCYNPVLGFCPQLRKFMAYGEEGFQPAFGASDTIPLHRFDKLAKKFTVVFNSLRDALPSFESDLLAIPSSPDAGPGGKSPTDSKAKSLFASFLRAEKLASSSSSSSDSMDENSKPSTENNTSSKPKSAAATDNNTKWENKGTVQDNNLHTDAQTTGGQKIPETLLEEPEGIPLAASATNLLCDVLWLPQHRPHSASVSTFLRISGKSFESYLQDCLDIFLSKDSLLGYLESITAAIKVWGTCDELSYEKDVQYSETDLKNCLKQKIPVWLCWMWGRNRVDNTIERLTKGCQNANLNQDIILCIVELIFSKLLVVIDNTPVNVEQSGEK